MSTLHCWTDRDEETDPTWDKWADEKSYTCMLPDGHVGSHEWTADGDISVAFEPSATPLQREEPGR